jgi:hypothetical protein
MPASYAGDDLNADVNGFASVLDQAPGLVLRVAIDTSGRENTATAELRVANRAVSGNEDVMAVFNSGIETKGQPEITPEDVARDSSTFGFFGFRYYNSWAPSYYYYTYTPVYYTQPTYYYYTTPVYYYTSWPTYYRYYYYPRYHFFH